jgi:hypothetical protein
LVHPRSQFVVPCGIAPMLPFRVWYPFVIGDDDEVHRVLLLVKTFVFISSKDNIVGDLVIRIFVVSTL